jgi:hypothetical protein
MNGYSTTKISTIVEDLCSVLRNPQLPVLEIKEIYSRLFSRLPKEISNGIEKILKQYLSLLSPQLINKPTSASSSSSTAAGAAGDAVNGLSVDGRELNNAELVGKQLTAILNAHSKSLTDAKKKEFNSVCDPLIQIALKYECGLIHHKETILAGIFKTYLEVERQCQSNRESYLNQLRLQYKDNLKKIFEIELSHANFVCKNELVSLLIDRAESKESLHSILHEMSQLTGK